MATETERREDFAGYAEYDKYLAIHSEDNPGSTVEWTGNIPDEVVNTPFTLIICSRVDSRRDDRVGGRNIALRFGWPDDYRDNPELTEHEARYVAGMLRSLARDFEAVVGGSAD